MKIVVIVARVLLGLSFFVFGLNAFLRFIPMPPMSGPAGDFLGVLIRTHFVYFVAAVQVISGALFLMGRYLPLAIVLSGPVIYNIVVYHVTMDLLGLPMALVATLCWLLLFWAFRGYFSFLWEAKAAPRAN